MVSQIFGAVQLLFFKVRRIAFVRTPAAVRDMFYVFQWEMFIFAQHCGMKICCFSDPHGFVGTESPQARPAVQRRAGSRGWWSLTGVVAGGVPVRFGEKCSFSLCRGTPAPRSAVRRHLDETFANAFVRPCRTERSMSRLCLSCPPSARRLASR
jgi:hypothetical protein